MQPNEDSNVEFKRELNNKLKREIDSFLNSETGGTIYLGVDDQTHEAVEVPWETRHKWEETISSWITSVFFPDARGLIEVLPNEKVFTIHVRAGGDQPYAISTKGFDSKGVFLREGSSVVQATNSRIHRMIQNKINHQFDQMISPRQDLTFDAARKRFEKIGISFDEQGLHLRDQLGYNNAALLISDQNPYEVKVAIFHGSTISNFKDKQAFEGPISDQIDAVMAYLKLINWTDVQITGDPQRHERQNYPEVALREAVINGFLHRDYLLNSTVKVLVFNDRVMILSPGDAPDGLKLPDLKNGFTAVRNPTLIHILDKMDYIENYGTGIKRIFEAYPNTNLQPKIQIFENGFEVTLPNQNFIQNTNDLNSNELSNAISLTTNDELVIEVLKSASSGLSRTEIEELTGFTRNQMRTVIKHLIYFGIIEATGASISTVYRFVAKE